MTESFDVVVIGGGPGGYVAAIKAAQLGMKVACVEKRGALGGTCLNVGCIPSKALLHASEKYAEAKNHLGQYGVEVAGVTLNLPQFMKNKDDVVDGLTKGIEGLFKKNKITYYKGAGQFLDANQIAVTGEKNETIAAKNVIIATGSDIIRLPNIDIDEEVIVSSTGALSLPKVPKKMIVIGGGYIGLEMASVWRRLGTEIEVVEFADRITPNMDNDLSKALHKILEKDGFVFHLGHKVTGAKKTKNGAEVTIESAGGGESKTLNADVVLVCVGRKPFTEGLGLEAAGITLDERGRIPVNDHLQTAQAHIYAIGDVVRGPMLAHKAEEEGVMVAEILAGQKPHINYDAIPAVIYTAPEVASVGKTEEELKTAGINYRVGKFPFMANSRARANGHTEGFVKILADAATDRVLGGHIIGAEAGTMIAEIALLIEFGGASEDLARTCHAHPTMNEAVKEAALAAFAAPIHI